MTAQVLAPIAESQRQRALDELRLVGSMPERSYEDIVRIASALCDTPIALISLVDREQQWFKAKLGIDAARTERNMAVCDHAIQRPQELMEVGDLDLDVRFADNPILKGVGARFYAGMPLVTTEGAAIGTVCVLDHHPRQLNATQREGLESLARLTMTLIESRSRERAHEVVALLEQAVPPSASTPAAATSPTAEAPTPYSVAIVEIQDLAGLARRVGDRALERVLTQIDQDLEGCLDHGRGDSASRVTGSGEFVVVMRGDDVQARLAALERLATSSTDRLGTLVLLGVANTQGHESAGEVFLKADQALSTQKDHLPMAA